MGTWLVIAWLESLFVCSHITLEWAEQLHPNFSGLLQGAPGMVLSAKMVKMGDAIA